MTFRFIHIPKTGGTAFIDFLNNNEIEFQYGRKKILADGSIRYAKKHQNASFWPHKIPFLTIIRNPYTRIVSYYRYITKLGRIKNISWENFVFTKVDNITNTPSPWKSQFEYIANDKSEVIADTILKLESIDETLPSIFDYTIPILNKNVTNSDGTDYMKEYYYNKDIKEIIFNRFRVDFENFNYQM